MDTSKKILWCIKILIVAVYVLIVISTIKGLVEPLVAFITGVFALANISVGFYYWKAKNENLHKYCKDLSPEEFNKLKELINKYNGGD